nr:3-deoxy-D-manno-octulosonate 8-phosphate phosphatase [Chlorobium phaeobacteroides]
MSLYAVYSFTIKRVTLLSGFQFFGMQPSEADPSSRIQQALAAVRALVIPVDGVLNGGRMTIDGSGREICSISLRDATALKEALKQGLIVAVVSERDAEAYRPLLEQLGVTSLYLNAESVFDAYVAFRDSAGLDDDSCAYIGDDLGDISVLEQVGFPVTPIDGTDYLRHRVAYISAYEGGKGCVREIVEMILMQQGKWSYMDHREA